MQLQLSSGTDSEKGTGLQVALSRDLEKGTGSSGGSLRPRIFCLEHAIQTEELLRSKGGANVLVICHSGKVGFPSLSC